MLCQQELMVTLCNRVMLDELLEFSLSDNPALAHINLSSKHELFAKNCHPG
jgi:hypothetical protein